MQLRAFALIPVLATPLLAQTYPVSTLDPTEAGLSSEGRSLDLDGTRAIFGSFSNGAWISERQESGLWDIVAPLPLPSGVDASALFGWSVAVSGDLVAIGAPFHQPPGSSLSQGAVFVYERTSAGQWLLDAQLFHPTTVSGGYGYSIALDGDRLAVGAPFSQSVIDPTLESGLVHVYDRLPGGAWALDATLDLPGLVADDSLGVALDLDGDRLLVTAGALSPVDRKVVVYQRGPSGNWGTEAVLTSNSFFDSNLFGADVALDGNFAIVASPDSSGVGDVRAYERTAEGAWIPRSVELPPGMQSYDGFGTSVSVDGGHMLVGCPGCDGAVSGEGRADLYRRAPDGSWDWAETIEPIDAEPQQFAGTVVALDGGWALSGGTGDSLFSNGEGRVFVHFAYEASNGTPPEAFGKGTPGCEGFQTLGFNLPPLVGTTKLAIETYNAPPNAGGLGLIGLEQEGIVTDPFGLKLVFHVDVLANPLIFFGSSDAEGVGRINLPVPQDPSLVGAKTAIQTLWVDPGCPSESQGLSTSEGLRVVLGQG